MRVGVHVPVFGPLANADNILAVARRAEALGFDSVWSSDHVVMPARVESRYPYSATGQFLVPPDSTWFDPLIALAAVASVTARVRLGTSVVIVPYRNPIVLAKMVSSLDCLCHGRLILGCGAGWLKEELFEGDPDRRLWDDPRVLITPHVSGETDVNLHRGVDLFCDNLRRYLNGQPLENVVGWGRGY